MSSRLAAVLTIGLAFPLAAEAARLAPNPRPVAPHPRLLPGPAPVIQPGECVYLVGAPPGAFAAATEETGSGVNVEPDCSGTTNVTVGVLGDNSMQLFNERLDAVNGSCRATAWAQHAFEVGPAAGPVTGRIDIGGHLHGHGFSDTLNEPNSINVDVVVLESDPLTGAEEVLIREVAISRRLPSGSPQLDDDFHHAAAVQLRPDTKYVVRVELWGQRMARSCSLDFGPPGTGQGARYDSIEVCLDAPSAPLPVVVDLDPLLLDDLEAKLYRRECMPTVWLPAAQGGRLETARDLVADLLARAVASADPGVNVHVAQMRLASADSDAAAGQYQRACRNLSEGLRALTTP